MLLKINTSAIIVRLMKLIRVVHHRDSQKVVVSFCQECRLDWQSFLHSLLSLFLRYTVLVYLFWNLFRAVLFLSLSLSLCPSFIMNYYHYHYFLLLVCGHNIQLRSYHYILTDFFFIIYSSGAFCSAYLRCCYCCSLVTLVFFFPHAFGPPLRCFFCSPFLFHTLVLDSLLFCLLFSFFSNGLNIGPPNLCSFFLHILFVCRCNLQVWRSWLRYKAKITTTNLDIKKYITTITMFF